MLGFEVVVRHRTGRNMRVDREEHAGRRTDYIKARSGPRLPPMRLNAFFSDRASTPLRRQADVLRSHLVRPEKREPPGGKAENKHRELVSAQNPAGGLNTSPSLYPPHSLQSILAPRMHRHPRHTP